MPERVPDVVAAGEGLVLGLDPDLELESEQERRFRGGIELYAGLAIVLAWVVIAIFAPLIATHSPYVSVAAGLAPPSGENYFGTDRLGFDVFSRTIYAARQDLYLAVAGTGIALVIGVLIGIPVGFTRHWSGELTMRLFDGIQAFPLLVLALALVAGLGQSSGTIIAALAFVNIPIFVRVVRSQVLTLREQRFVEAAVASGNPTWRILFRHVLPNTWVPILAQATISIAFAIIIIAGLSFLGVGIKPPTPEWGLMIQTGYQNLISGQWWISIFPGLAVASVVLGFHLIGDGIQHAFTVVGRH
jgi:peptide/nickel transport system permease protein